jgi:hypothetical protein
MSCRRNIIVVLPPLRTLRHFDRRDMHHGHREP